MFPSAKLFKNALIFDGQTFLTTTTLLVESGKVVAIGDEAVASNPECESAEVEIVDCQGKWLLPGLVDCHVHFREPGLVRKEGYLTGSAGALHGGVTTVMEIQNNPPLMNSAALLAQKKQNLGGVSRVDFAPYGSLTLESVGQLHEMKAECPAVKCFLGCSTGAGGVHSEQEMRVLFQAAADADVLIVAHCEDNAVMKKSDDSLQGDELRRHDLRRPREAEVQSIQDAIRVAKEVGARLHVFHISTAEGGRMVADAAAGGQAVTGTTAPHYLLVDAEQAHAAPQNRFKVNPAIKYADDRQGLLALVEAGKLQGVGTDHAPHPMSEKDRAYDKAPSGFPSVDLLLPLMVAASDQSELTLERALSSVTKDPADEFQLLQKGRIAVGADADLVLADPDLKKVVDENQLLSKSGWSPYEGRELRAFPEKVWLRGELVFADGQVLGEPIGKPLLESGLPKIRSNT